MNYYCKYWELIDTIFLALKKKPLSACSLSNLAACSALRYSRQHSYTSSTMRQLLCCAIHSWMERLASYVTFVHLSSPRQNSYTHQQWAVISLNLAVHVLMCTFLPLSCTCFDPRRIQITITTRPLEEPKSGYTFLLSHESLSYAYIIVETIYHQHANHAIRH